MTRYWLDFDVPPHEPYNGPGLQVDGGDTFTPIGRVRAGVGVTAKDLDDALRIVGERIFGREPLPPVRKVTENVDLSDFAQHVLVTMEPPIWSGIWFPRGYAESPMT